MINIQPYIDKLEALKEFIYWKIETPDKLNRVKATTDLTVAFGHFLIASVKTMTFNQWLESRHQSNI